MLYLLRISLSPVPCHLGCSPHYPLEPPVPMPYHIHKNYLMRRRNSMRVSYSARKTPRITDEVMRPGVRIPRADIHRCSPLSTTATSSVPVMRLISSAIC